MGVHGLRGWTDGRAWQAQAASVEPWAGIAGLGGGGAWLTRTDGRVRGYKQGWADGQADGPNRVKISRDSRLVIVVVVERTD